jgi:hypothetical protein
MSGMVEARGQGMTVTELNGGAGRILPIAAAAFLIAMIMSGGFKAATRPDRLRAYAPENPIGVVVLAVDNSGVNIDA